MPGMHYTPPPAAGDAAAAQADIDAHEALTTGVHGLADADATEALAAGAIPKSVVDAADDLIVGSGADAVTRLAVGASTIPAKLAAGGLIAATPTQVRTLLALGTAALVDTGTSAANVPTITQGDGRYRQRASTATYADVKRHTSAGIVQNGTSWANVNQVGTTCDITLTAAVGDWIEVWINALWGNEAVAGYVDVVSIVSGSPFKNWSQNIAEDNAHFGAFGWAGNASAFYPATGSVWRPVASGDLTGSTVVLRVRCRTSAAVNKSMFAAAGTPWLFGAINHG